VTSHVGVPTPSVSAVFDSRRPRLMDGLYERLPDVDDGCGDGDIGAAAATPYLARPSGAEVPWPAAVISFRAKFGGRILNLGWDEIGRMLPVAALSCARQKAA
jgi:hypothetical protein